LNELSGGEKRIGVRTSIGDFIEMDNCPDCSDNRFIHNGDRGELVCGDCGLIIHENLVDQGPEWSSFSQDEETDKSRVGSPLSNMTHDRGLSTKIGFRNRDIQGNSIPKSQRHKFYRLRKWHKRTRIEDAKSRNLAVALGELNRMAQYHGIPSNIQEEASSIYREAANKDLIKGRSIEGVVATSLYIACRKFGVPRTLDEVAEAARISRKELGRTYRFLASELGIQLRPVKPEDYLPRFCSKLDLGQEELVEAKCIVKSARKKNLIGGRSPIGIAAASIYIAGHLTGDGVSQKEVAEVTDTTEVTIRNRYQEIKKELNLRF